MATWTVSDSRQTLFDVAACALGSIEGVYALAVLNKCSVTDRLAAGQVLIIPEAVDNRVVEYYHQEGVVPATDVVDSALTIFDSSFDITFE
ncbi:MAG: LysM domain-containing protein [Rikenellaceae bacterium]|nr:LysM domain-containing protein [Rikenellaceae bacterium]